MHGHDDYFYAGLHLSEGSSPYMEGFTEGFKTYRYSYSLFSFKKATCNIDKEKMIFRKYFLKKRCSVCLQRDRKYY
jgi:hypothetical protein